MKKNQIEILSPAGSEEAFYAAIHQGADAVYLGGLKFGARAYANNFTTEKLRELIQYAHLYQVKVYYALNTLIKDIEFHEFEQLVEELNELPIDAFIIQDFGVYAYLRKNYPRFILHGSTQMNLHNAMDAAFAKALGFDRIVLARECSLQGIEDISKNVDIELEIFVHGALCYSYSGQCLMSSLYGGRSGNRGKCAQPCRLAYQSKGHKGNLISLKDQMTLELLPKLNSLGIHSYKIEGRMKGESYVAYTTYLYSKYRDLACRLHEEGHIQDYKVDSKEVYQMNQLYNRGHYNQGYFVTHNHKDMLSLSISKHQGVEIGTIRYEKGLYRFNLLPNIFLQKGDLLEMHLPDGQVKEIQVSDEGKKADLQLFHKKKELPLYRLRDSSLQDEISMMKKKKLPLSFNLFVQENSPMLLILEFAGIKVQVEGEKASVAINKAFDEQAFYKQLAKIQDTVFEIHSYTIQIEGKVFVATSSINELRRRGIETLQEEILRQYENQLNKKKDDIVKNLEKNTYRNTYMKSASKELYDTRTFSSKFNVILRTEEQLFAIIESELSDVFRICIDINNFTVAEVNKLIRIARSHYHCEIYMALPVVVLYEYENTLKDFLHGITEPFDGFLVRSVGQIELAKQMNVAFALDYNMNVFNREARDFWIAQGASSICPSQELNGAAFRALLKGKEEYLEQYVYGKLALMHSSSCILKTTEGCRYQDHGNRLRLEDRKGEVLTTVTNCRFCHNSIYNSKACYLLDVMEEVSSLKRIEFTDEDAKSIIDIFSKHNPYSFADKNYTRGHYKRGVD